METSVWAKLPGKFSMDEGEFGQSPEVRVSEKD